MDFIIDHLQMNPYTNAQIDKRLGEVFLKCVRRQSGRLSFSAEDLLAHWFQAPEQSTYFLFQKNLSRTNIQFAELISLIRLHTTNKLSKDDDDHNLHFVLVHDFLKTIQEVVDDLLKSKPSLEVLRDTFVQLYSVLRHTILLQVFHGSCIVLLPPHMELSLLKVCSESGYIHSCGYCIYARDLQYADSTSFKRTIIKYLDRIFTDRRIFVAVYSHEDFDGYDRKHSAALSGGLENVKISAEKYYVGNKSLVRVLQEIKTARSNRVFIPAGPYKEHAKIRKDQDIQPDRTIWLNVDRLIGDNIQHPSERQFLICYDQQYKNRNPLQIFDENKPAWTSHTTIPHTLAAAMLNISRPVWPKRGVVSIYDPFSGTGTTAMEALKFPKTHIRSNDISADAKMLLQDNLAFFCADATKLEQIADELDDLSNPDGAELPQVPSAHASDPTPYSRALTIYDKLTAGTLQDAEGFEIPDEIVQMLLDKKTSSLGTRLRFYLALRTQLRHATAYQRRNEPWRTAYRKEAGDLAFQTRELLSIRKRLRKPAYDAFSLMESTYSQACTIDPEIFRQSGNSLRRINITRIDARRPPNAKFDLIITDPPYGFNTGIDSPKLANLLADALDVLILSLKDTSQLIIALPDRSHSGRHIPVFATKTWVTQKVIAKAEQHHFEVVIPATIIPRVGRLFEAPYYWKSERALTRAILHFHFRKKATP